MTDPSVPPADRVPTASGHPWRRRAFEILEVWEPGDRVATGVNVAIIVMIVVSVAGTILETEAFIRQHYRIHLQLIEVIAVTLFTIEYVTRVWANAERMPRWRYVTTFSSVIDLLAIAPFFLVAFLGIDLLFLRALRLLRILKLTRYFAPLGILWNVLKAEGRAFLAALIVLAVLTMIAASVMYWAENEAQPEAFRSIPTALWWAVVTLTTVGYGDVTPVTPLGRFIGTLIMVLGIGMVALPAGMLASRFSEELHKRREAFRRTVRRVRRDGTLTEAELDKLDGERADLCLSEHDAETILADDAARHDTGVCPTCHRPLDRTPARQ